MTTIEFLAQWPADGSHLTMTLVCLVVMAVAQ